MMFLSSLFAFIFKMTFAIDGIGALLFFTQQPSVTVS